MANIKSAQKKALIAERNEARNTAFKSSIKTAVKKVLSLVEGDKKELTVALSNVYQLCDKAVSKGILHKNTAARKKSRLTKAINKLQENAQTKTEPKKVEAKAAKTAAKKPTAKAKAKK